VAWAIYRGIAGLRKSPCIGRIGLAENTRELLCGCTWRCVPGRRLPWPSTGPASGLGHALDSGYDFVMFEQLAATGRGAAFFDRLDEPGVVFQHAVHGFRNELRGLSAGTRGDVLEPRLLFR
jgi:hypothetical protein